MGFDWDGAVEGGGGKRLPRTNIKSGVHFCRAMRVLTTDRKTGGPYRTRAGDPKILIAWRSCGAEGLDDVPLGDNAGFRIARILARSGADMARVKADDLGPSDFADKKIAEAWLVSRDGRPVWCWHNVKRNGQKVDFEPLKESEVVQRIGAQEARRLREAAEAANERDMVALGEGASAGEDDDHHDDDHPGDDSAPWEQ